MAVTLLADNQLGFLYIRRGLRTISPSRRSLPCQQHKTRYTVVAAADLHISETVKKLVVLRDVCVY